MPLCFARLLGFPSLAACLGPLSDPRGCFSDLVLLTDTKWSHLELGIVKHWRAICLCLIMDPCYFLLFKNCVCVWMSTVAWRRTSRWMCVEAAVGIRCLTALAACQSG